MKRLGVASLKLSANRFSLLLAFDNDPPPCLGKAHRRRQHGLLEQGAHEFRGYGIGTKIPYVAPPMQQIIKLAVARLPSKRECGCAGALKDAIVTRPEHIPPEQKQKLDLLIGKYLKGAK